MTILKLRRTLVALATVAAASAAVPAVATAADGNQVTKFSTADRAAALAYWTPGRMKAVGADSDGRVEQLAKPWPGAAPRGVGRLFFTEAAPGEPEQDSWCTATAVPSATGDVVVTAGHCAYAGTDREDQVIRVRKSVFVPGYDHGRQPHGVFAARALAFRTSYTIGSDPDVAMVVLDPHDGQHVDAAAGTQRISFDHKGKTPAATFGYPGSKEFFGEGLEWCQVSVQQDPAEFDHWRSGCDMAGGSSGGPWFANFDPRTGSGLIFSVNSRGATGFDENTGESYTENLEGAPLDAGAKALYEAAGNL